MFGFETLQKMALRAISVIRWLRVSHEICRQGRYYIYLVCRFPAQIQLPVLVGRSDMGSSSVNLGDMRVPYNEMKDTFVENDLPCQEPIGLFSVWFKTACETPAIEEPNAMALATADKYGRPSARFVLLKGFGKDGFKFFSNYESRKGKELEENSFAALAFLWHPLHRQVRIEGPVQKLSEEESEEYFHLRLRDAQISALISNQSTVVPSREFLLQKQEDNKIKYEGMTIPKPKTWGGYIIKPEVIEFWQGQTNRLHDRIRFRYQPNYVCADDMVKIGEDGWVYERLAP